MSSRRRAVERTRRVGFGGESGAPGLALRTGHPYATGFTVDGVEIGVESDASPAEGRPAGYWPFPLDASGDHVVEVAVRTAYGTVRGGGRVAFTVA